MTSANPLSTSAPKYRAKNRIAASAEGHIAPAQGDRAIHGVAIATNEYRVHRGIATPAGRTTYLGKFSLDHFKYIARLVHA